MADGKKLWQVSIHEVPKKPLFVFGYGNDDIVLSEVYEFKHLGIVFTPNLKWDKHVNFICSRTLTAFKTIVRTILDYGYIVWDPYLKEGH